MVPVSEMDLSTVKYEPQVVQAPHLTGNVFRFFIKLLESPIIGPFLMSHLKKENKMIEMLRCTEIPEPPMFVPEYPTQAQSRRVVLSPWRKMVNQKDELNQHWNLFLSMILQPTWNMDSSTPFRHWRIRDFAHAYRSKLISPSVAAENVITAIEESYKSEPHQPLLISFDAAEVREQAAASTQRWFEEGNPISILDGIFIGIKDDIDCYPHPTKGGTTWLHEVRSVKRDAVCVSRLRSCGAILVGKANMHELGMGTTGNNSNHGTVRNPYAPDRYTGGSSSGPAAIVASGICCAAVGCDGGGSVRIPSSLCGVVGLKATIGRTDMGGSLCDGGGVSILGPITSCVEDSMIVYAAMLGSSIADKISVRPEKSARLTYESLTSDALFRSFTGSEYVSAQCLRRRIMHHHTEIFKNVDVIVTPTIGMTATLIPRGALKYGESDMKTTWFLMRFIIAPNLIGLPAISVPVGYDKEGLPIGLQLIGRPWEEATILRLAFAIQELCATRIKKPASFYDVLKAN
ncbi:Fatty acid amide hydrolase [Linum grandiflorum]